MISIFQLVKDNLIVELIVMGGLVVVIVYELVLFDVLGEDLVSDSDACISDVEVDYFFHCII